MVQNLSIIKPIISSILFALGQRATERQFRREFKEIEGFSFDIILNRFHKDFVGFMLMLSDVCELYMINDQM